MRIHGAHVGQNDFVARFEPIHDFDCVYGGAAQFHRNSRRRPPFGIEAKEGDGCVRLARRRPADIEDVAETFDVDGAVHAEVGAGSLGQRAVQGDVDQNRSVHCRWIYARNAARDCAVVGVDRGRLVQRDVFGFGFGDPDLSFQVILLSDFGKDRTGGYVLADFERRSDTGCRRRRGVAELLQDAGDARPYAEPINLLFLELVHGLELVDFDALRGELGFRGTVNYREALFFDLIADFELAGFGLRIV